MQPHDFDWPPLFQINASWLLWSEVTLSACWRVFGISLYLFIPPLSASISALTDVHLQPASSLHCLSAAFPLGLLWSTLWFWTHGEQQTVRSRGKQQQTYKQQILQLTLHLHSYLFPKYKTTQPVHRKTQVRWNPTVWGNWPQECRKTQGAWRNTLNLWNKSKGWRGRKNYKWATLEENQRWYKHTECQTDVKGKTEGHYGQGLILGKRWEWAGEELRSRSCLGKSELMMAQEALKKTWHM